MRRVLLKARPPFKISKPSVQPSVQTLIELQNLVQDCTGFTICEHCFEYYVTHQYSNMFNGRLHTAYFTKSYKSHL